MAFLPLVVCYYYQKLPVERQTLRARDSYLLWVMVPVFTSIAIRGYYMGADTGSYIDDFYRFASMDFDSAVMDTRMEPGFVFFSKSIALITSSAKIFQVIYTSIYFVCIYSFIKRFEGTIPFYFLFFFITLGEYLFFFTGVRQCLAISVCLYSYKYIIEKKWVYFVPIIALMYTIHHSVIFFVIVYFLVHFKVSKYNIVLYFITLYFASTYLVDAQSYLNERLDYTYEIEQADSGGIFLTLIALFSAASYHQFSKKMATDSTIRYLFNINIITLFFWVLRLQTRVAERPSFYFLPFSCVLFAYLYTKTKNKSAKYIMIIIPVVYYLYRFTGTFITFVPYKTFFFD